MEKDAEVEGIAGGEVGDDEGFLNAEDLGELVGWLALCRYKASSAVWNLHLWPTLRWA